MFGQRLGLGQARCPLTLIATVGIGVERPTVHDDEQIVARPMLPLTLSFDHAVIDGAPAARFTETLRNLTETAAALHPPRRSPTLGERPPARRNTQERARDGTPLGGSRPDHPSGAPPRFGTAVAVHPGASGCNESLELGAVARPA